MIGKKGIGAQRRQGGRAKQNRALLVCHFWMLILGNLEKLAISAVRNRTKAMVISLTFDPGPNFQADIFGYKVSTLLLCTAMIF